MYYFGGADFGVSGDIFLFFIENVFFGEGVCVWGGGRG